jgi:hypothetical protein
VLLIGPKNAQTLASKVTENKPKMTVTIEFSGLILKNLENAMPKRVVVK